MSASLKQYLWIGIIILSSAILFFTFPERANAQTEAHNAASVQDSQNEYPTVAPSTRYVVQTGDSLWSISQQWLGPNATPAQIADEVERIYALNQGQIEDNPNFLPGLELLLPPLPKPATFEEAAGFRRARDFGEACRFRAGSSRADPRCGHTLRCACGPETCIHCSDERGKRTRCGKRRRFVAEGLQQP